jgi:hypothetical protein
MCKRMQLPLSLRQPSLPLPLRLLLLPLLLRILPNPRLPLLPLQPLQPLMLLMTMFRTEHFVCMQQTPHLRHQGVFKVQPCPTPTTKTRSAPPRRAMARSAPRLTQMSRAESSSLKTPRCRPVPSAQIGDTPSPLATTRTHPTTRHRQP